eukprot:6166959-Alexandrium_andersonii.AAC.1
MDSRPGLGDPDAGRVHTAHGRTSSSWRCAVDTSSSCTAAGPRVPARPTTRVGTVLSAKSAKRRKSQTSAS